MKEISAADLRKLIDDNADFKLIDVREEYEYDEANIKGHLIPMGEVMDRVDEIPRDKKVVVHCRSGKRSASVIQALESQHGYTNLFNLKGGILAYLEETGENS
jgi:rhodanese-related sulfurtransferase